MERQAESRAELEASIAELAEAWEEQTRALHFALRDLGDEAGCFGWVSPFESALARPAARREGAHGTLPLGAVRA